MEWWLEKSLGSGNLQKEGGGLVNALRSLGLLTGACSSYALPFHRDWETRMLSSGVDWSKP